MARHNKALIIILAIVCVFVCECSRINVLGHDVPFLTRAKSERDVLATSWQFRLFCDRYETQILTGKIRGDDFADEHEPRLKLTQKTATIAAAQVEAATAAEAETEADVATFLIFFYLRYVCDRDKQQLLSPRSLGALLQ